MALHRFSTKISSLSVTAAVATTPEILYGEYTSGMVHVAAGSAAVTFTWHVAPEAGGTYLPASDYDGVAVTQTVAHTNAYPIPLALIGARAIKVVGDDTATIDISLKG